MRVYAYRVGPFAMTCFSRLKHYTLVFDAPMGSQAPYHITALRDAQVLRAGDRMWSDTTLARAGFVGTIDVKTLGGQRDMI